MVFLAAVFSIPWDGSNASMFLNPMVCSCNCSRKWSGAKMIPAHQKLNFEMCWFFCVFFGLFCLFLAGAQVPNKPQISNCRQFLFGALPGFRQSWAVRKNMTLDCPLIIIICTILQRKKGSASCLGLSYFDDFLGHVHTNSILRKK